MEDFNRIVNEAGALIQSVEREIEAGDERLLAAAIEPEVLRNACLDLSPAEQAEVDRLASVPRQRENRRSR